MLYFNARAKFDNFFSITWTTDMWNTEKIKLFSYAFLANNVNLLTSGQRILFKISCSGKAAREYFFRVNFYPNSVNFFKYPFLDLVELFVTKNIIFPKALNLSKTLGTPGINDWNNCKGK